jgi:four helix bundle protein
MKSSQPLSYSQSAGQPSESFRTFEDLEVYKLAREFRMAMYSVTRRLPDFEKFELASQIRRAAVSLTNNIAEGHGRFHYLEQIKFTLNARGSLEELIDDLNICEDERYLPPSEVEKLKTKAWQVHRVMAGYLRYLRGRKEGSSRTLHEGSPAYGLTESDLDTLLAEASDSPSTL